MGAANPVGLAVLDSCVESLKANGEDCSVLSGAKVDVPNEKDADPAAGEPNNRGFGGSSLFSGFFGVVASWAEPVTGWNKERAAGLFLPLADIRDWSCGGWDGVASTG